MDTSLHMTLQLGHSSPTLFNMGRDEGGGGGLLVGRDEGGGGGGGGMGGEDMGGGEREVSPMSSWW